MLKKYAGEEFLVLEIPLREKFMIPCKYIYPCLELAVGSDMKTYKHQMTPYTIPNNLHLGKNALK